ncbi:chorismate synthase [Brucepastera parasyntrophica]|uniref:chorismate synthase n=1 Tax=Brucepastera parasyntrophica TaxID=2880008 RepID=UPI00210D0866|nr:chorismate synthase [Brucepastera parasyntrophica]ULQ60380.1 chorismate synthase [Brucepastera parasyntrophica]
MAGNTFGTVFRVTTFGESHGEALGVVIDGCPPGIQVDPGYIQKELDRRRPGFHGREHNPAITDRKEADHCEILSGIFEGKSTGAPIAALIRNTNQHSSDYDTLKNVFRPGHADFTWQKKYGIRDYRGGGRSSGRETAARVIAGAVAKTFLASKGITVIAWTQEAAGISCETRDESVIEANTCRAPDMEAAEKMTAEIAALREKGDSAGGIISCRISGVPAGLGEPVFDKLDAELAHAILSVGAVKGIEFGAGFASARMTGSEWNDEMTAGDEQDNAGFSSNNAGGILGGISTGADIFFNAAIKPVPSIAKIQKTVTVDGAGTSIEITGRHDACLCPRIVPVIEAMAAIVIADMYLRQLTSAEK